MSSWSYSRYERKVRPQGVALLLSGRGGFLRPVLLRYLTADHVSHGGPASIAATRPSTIWLIQKAIVVKLIRSPVVALLSMSIESTYVDASSGAANTSYQRLKSSGRRCPLYRWRITRILPPCGLGMSRGGGGGSLGTVAGIGGSYAAVGSRT